MTSMHMRVSFVAINHAIYRIGILSDAFGAVRERVSSLVHASMAQCNPATPARRHSRRSFRYRLIVNKVSLQNDSSCGARSDVKSSELCLSGVSMARQLAQIESDEDVLWKADERETDEEIGARGTRFFEWLMQARG